MQDRAEHEGDLFRRYEARIVTLEIKVTDLELFEAKYSGYVDDLRSAQLIATALLAKTALARSGLLPKWQIGVAILALFVPQIVGSLLMYLILKG